MTYGTTKGVFGGPSGPSREGPGVGHKIDTKQITKERKNICGKRKKCVKEKNRRKMEEKWKKNGRKWSDINGKR